MGGSERGPEVLYVGSRSYWACNTSPVRRPRIYHMTHYLRPHSRDAHARNSSTHAQRLSARSRAVTRCASHGLCALRPSLACRRYAHILPERRERSPEHQSRGTRISVIRARQRTSTRINTGDSTLLLESASLTKATPTGTACFQLKRTSTHPVTHLCMDGGKAWRPTIPTYISHIASRRCVLSRHAIPSWQYDLRPSCRIRALTCEQAQESIPCALVLTTL